MARQLNWIVAVLAIASIALVSVSPFLSDAMPLTDDGNLHVYRAIVLDDALRNNGTLYPRYVSGLAYGYGASLFNYFPPTSYYPTVIFHHLGLNWVTAWQATMIAYVLLAGVGTWLWAREWLDETGAIVAAAAYVYAPYTLFDTITRGSSNEFAGMALLPFALWGFTRLARHGKRRDFLIAIISYALFIMAHNVMTLYGSLLLVAYCGILLINNERWPRLIWQLASAGILAVLLTSFFWLPALTETQFVKIDGVLDNLAFIDVTNTLRSLGDVFAWPQTADPSQLQARVPISFSWVALILGIVGFFLPQPSNRDDLPITMLGLHLFLFGIVLIVTLSQLPLAAEVWQSVRLLQYSQFAWRPMSIGSLALALLTGIGASFILHLLANRVIRLATLSGLLIVLVMYSVPWLYRPSIPFDPQTVADAQQYEISSQQPVLSSYGEYLPVQTLETALDPQRFQGQSERIRSTPSVTVSNLMEQGTRLTATVDVAEDRVLSLDWLYVPGWRARVDGQSVDVMPVGEAGFVGFEITRGTHEIEVWYGGTRLQQFATLLSGLALIATLAMTVLAPFADQSVPTAVRRDLPALLTICAVGLLLFALKILWLDQSATFLSRSRLQDGALTGVSTPLAVNFDNQIELLGIEYPERVSSGDQMTIDLYWRLADEPIKVDYSSIVQLINADGIVIAEASNFYPAGLATSNWIPSYYVEDTLSLTIPAFTPPIAYELVVGLYESETGRRLDIMNDANNPIGINASIGQVQIERPTSTIDTRELPLPMMSAVGFQLLALDGLPEVAQVGDQVTFSWLWLTTNPLGEFSPQLMWGQEARTSFDDLVIGLPQDAWQVNDVWRGYHRVIVPPTLPAGTYPLRIAFSGRIQELPQSIIITVPERDFDLPERDATLDAMWENGIILRGYRIAPDGQFELYWQTDEIISQPLRLFVQVVTTEGQLLAVQDTIPQRQTTSWIPEEVITTSHRFEDITSDNELQLLVGWVNQQTDQRITLDETTEDALTLPYPLAPVIDD